MKNVYLIDYSQFTRLNLISNLIDPSLSFIKLRSIIEQQGGDFLEINNPTSIQRIQDNISNGIIYQYAINAISKDQFTNAMSILFKLDNLQFIEYWESVLNIDDLSLISLEQLAQLQQSSDFDIHLSGNLTELNADWLNIKIAFTGLKNIQYTYSFTEGTLLDSDYVTKVVADKYPSTEFNVIDLRSNGILTPDIFPANLNQTTDNLENPEDNINQPSSSPALIP